MSRVHRIVLGVLGCACVVVAAVVWWRGHAQSASTGLPAAAAHVPEQSSPTPPPTVARLGAAQTPLPEDGTPLRLVYAGLRQRAGSGDARAACRLAAELEQCEHVRTQLAQFDDQLAFQQEQMDREPDPAQRARMQQGLGRFTGRGQRLLAEAEQCDGVPPVSPVERANLWRAAALGGSLPALTQYAVGNAFRLRDTLELLPQLQIYRNEAEALALQAAQRGSVKATLALAAAYSPNRDTGRRTFLAQVVKPDPVRSLALYLQAQRVSAGEATEPATPQMAMRLGVAKRNTEVLRRNMAPDQLAQAEALATGWARDWAAPGAMEGSFSADGGTSDITPSACSE